MRCNVDTFMWSVFGMAIIVGALIAFVILLVSVPAVETLYAQQKKPPPRIVEARLLMKCDNAYLIYTSDVGIYIYDEGGNNVGSLLGFFPSHKGVIQGPLYFTRQPPPYYTYNGTPIVVTRIDVENECMRGG